MNERGEHAKALFLEGYNCAQSVLLAFQEELGLDQSTIARLASSFGGGMGRLREVCGAVSAMFMVAGLLCGYDNPHDDDAKAEHYQRIQALAAAFRQCNGSIICRELLGLPGGPDSAVPSKRTAKYYAARPCADLIGNAAELLEAFLSQQQGPSH